MEVHLPINIINRSRSRSNNSVTSCPGNGKNSHCDMQYKGEQLKAINSVQVTTNQYYVQPRDSYCNPLLLLVDFQGKERNLQTMLRTFISGN